MAVEGPPPKGEGMPRVPVTVARIDDIGRTTCSGIGVKAAAQLAFQVQHVAGRW